MGEEGKEDKMEERCYRRDRRGKKGGKGSRPKEGIRLWPHFVLLSPNPRIHLF